MKSLLNFDTRIRRSSPGHFLPVFFAAFILFSTTAKAQGDLLLYPKRIVLEGKKKAETINLSNTGKDTVKYFISVVQSRMKPDGGFETITVADSGQHFADKYFRIYPRNVVLGPKESQSVKIQLLNTTGLEPGEYRSHIYFRSEPDKKALGEAEPLKDSTSISVNIVAIFGITIPIIIRVGESTTNVSLSDASFEMKQDAIPTLKVTFNRSGNMSTYGDVAVEHISMQGKVTRVGSAKGMALYTPNLLRHFILLLDKNAGIDYHKGRLHIAYTTQADAKSIKIAETDLELKM